MGAGRPAEQPPGFFVGGVLPFAKFGKYKFYRGVTERGETHQPVGELACRNFAFMRNCSGLQRPGMNSKSMRGDSKQHAADQYFDVADGAKEQHWYFTSHEFNDKQSRKDRREWLTKELGCERFATSGALRPFNKGA